MTNDSVAAPSSVALFGCDHIGYGQVHKRQLLDGSTFCSISVGSDPETPAQNTKGGQDSLNEDALFAYDDGDRVLLATADAHFGFESSHHLIREIERLAPELLGAPAKIADIVRDIHPSAEARSSESTLLLAIYDRLERQGFGISVGDSSLALVAGEGARIVNMRTPRFLAPAAEHGMAWDEAAPFVFFTAPGSLLLAFTDGINECHYRSARTSVAERHLHALFQKHGADPEGYSEALMQLALDGVDGNPGGQDNICLIAARS